MRFILAAILCLAASLSYAAGPCRNGQCWRQQTSVVAYDALERLNYQRAQRGLYAYERDEELTQGALAVAKYRAEHGIHGHSKNDFGFLPKGVHAPMAGCAAWRYGSGFGACEAYGKRFKKCGAAWAVGRDGLVYSHAFYSN